MDHKSSIYSKTQDNLSWQQASWIKLLKYFNLNIVYKPGKELVTANTLSLLYSKNPEVLEGLDPNWPVLALKNLGDG